MQNNIIMELIPPNFGAINQRNGNIPRNQFGQQNNAFINRNNKKKIVESDKSKNEYKSDDKRTFPKVYKNDQYRRIYTGNIDRVIRWYKIINFFCQYEVYGPILTIRDGTIDKEKVILLREKKGPTLQVIYYVSDYVNVTNFDVGTILRCVGIMIGPNVLRAFKIKIATKEDRLSLQRLCYLSDHSIKNIIALNI